MDVGYRLDAVIPDLIRDLLTAVRDLDENSKDLLTNTIRPIMFQELIQNLPKAELHIHIEGSFEPELMFEIASRNNVNLAYDSIESLKSAYQFTQLQDFLDIYYQGMSALHTEQDFYDLTMAYMQQCKRDNVVHAEIFFDPQGHTHRGVEFATVIDGIHGALVDTEQNLGISSHLIMCFLRHLDEEDAFKTLEQSLPYRDKIIGVGLDSTELGNPPQKFVRAFSKAREYGYLCVAHAGEEGPAQYVKDTVELLKVNRIDHGNRCLEDPELVKLLAASQIPLTVCPLSNLKLGGVKDMCEHPLKSLIDAGLMVTVNSDDPAYFGGYINQNYMSVQQALDLSNVEIVRLAENSIHASFLNEEQKQIHLSAIKAISASNF